MEREHFSEEELKIFKKYPNLFRQTQLSAKESCMYWGLDCPVAWFPQIELLCEELKQEEMDKFVEFAQVKSKFKFCRCYLTYLTDDKTIKDKINTIVDKHISIINDISYTRMS